MSILDRIPLALLPLHLLLLFVLSAAIMAMLKQSALEEQNGFSIMQRLLSRRSRPKPGEAKLREPLLPLMLLILMVLTLVHSLQDLRILVYLLLRNLLDTLQLLYLSLISVHP